MRTAFVIALLCLGVDAQAHRPDPSQDPVASEREAPAARITDLAWLAGSWTGQGFGGALRETYSPPAGGQIVALFSSVSAEGPQFYEFEMIAQVGSTLEYRVKHFNPDMTGWEEKDKFVRFPLVSVSQDRWAFDGLTIRRTGADTMEIAVVIGSKDGKSREEVLKFTRAAP